MEKVKKCAACRYCRVHAFIKLSAVLLVGAIVTIVMMFEGRV